MNSTRLYLIATEILNDIEKHKLLQAFDSFIGAINNLMSAQNEQHQTQLVDAKASLISKLNSSAFNDLPRTWASSIEELGLNDFFGADVAAEIETLMKDNEKTLVVVKDYAQSIRDQIQVFHNSFSGIVSAHDSLGIAPKELERGDAELSLLIPNAELKGSLKTLSTELKVFNDFVDDASELSGEPRGQMKLREISSSDPSLVIIGAAATVLAVLKAVREVQKVIEGTYKIREAKAAAEAAEIKRDTIELMAEQARTQIRSGLANVVELMLNNAVITDQTRLDGLRRRITQGIEQIADRLDHGFQIEGDSSVSEDVATDAENEDGEEPDDSAKIAAEIKEISSEIRHVDLPGEPILQLEAPEQEGDEQD